MVSNAKTEMIAGMRKAAILLVCLGEQASGEVVKQLGEEEVQAVSREIARLGEVTPEQAEAVLDEFFQMVLAREYIFKGGLDYARRLLVSAYGPDTARKLLDHLQKTMGSDLASLDVLQKADPQQLAKFIHSEHPQTIASIVSHLNPSQAAALLMALPARHPLRRGAAHGQPRPDLAGGDQQDRRRDRQQAERAGRVEPRVLRRRARGGGDAEPPRFGHQQGDAGQHRAAGAQPGRSRAPPDVRLRGPAADRRQRHEGGAAAAWTASC